MIIIDYETENVMAYHYDYHESYIIVGECIDGEEKIQDNN